MRELGRALAILAASTVLGLGANALSARPVPLFRSDGPGAWPDRAPRISVEELRSAGSSGRALLLLDVRGEDEFKSGHAPQAVHAPATDFLRHYQRLGLASVLKAADEVVVVCESEDCPAADRVARVLKDLGHRGVRVLEGGWKAGRRAGLEGSKP